VTTARSSQGLRRKLIGLLSAFGAFAFLVAIATIYGTQWYVGRAVVGFERAIGQTVRADRMHLSLEKQVFALHALVEGRDDATRSYFTSRDAFFTSLRQLASYADGDGKIVWSRLLAQTEGLTAASDACLAFLVEGKQAEARYEYSERIELTILPELEARIVEAKTALDAQVNTSTRRLAATSSQVLSLTVVIGGLAALLVIIGAMLIRRWLLTPITTLHEAANRFGQGELNYQVDIASDDELGSLADAMNDMARSVLEAHEKLAASETKHRLLFQELQDAVILVDQRGEIIEYHDGDSRLLGVEGAGPIGKTLLDAWPHWESAECDWDGVIQAAINQGLRYRAIDVALSCDASGERSRLADILVYRVDAGDARHAAIVLRDVTQRVQLQRKLRQAETMEAVGTLAGGLAHDFNNLLAGVIGTLSLLEGDVGNERHAERIRAAVRTCWQASALSRRLLNFAGSAHGEPQVFCARDGVQLILDSLDPSFCEGIDLSANLGDSVLIRMDRDQFTQTLLNLVRNARDAMAEGGSLSLSISQAKATNPDSDRGEQLYAVITVADTGSGMTREVQARLFEPFYTTKSRAAHRGRGMGMAIVYSAVRNAGGFIQFESAPGQGTTFRVYLPVCEAVHGPTASKTQDVPAHLDAGRILLVDPNAMIRNTMATALQGWGYAVTACESASDALCEIENDTPTALGIVDLTMPGDDATRVALALHARTIGVVFTTTGNAPALSPVLEGVSLGRLVKPFEVDALAAVVYAAIAHAESKR
jgi:PAS domain S-box-containing protein